MPKRERPPSWYGWVRINLGPWEVSVKSWADDGDGIACMARVNEKVKELRLGGFEAEWVVLPADETPVTGGLIREQWMDRD